MYIYTLTYIYTYTERDVYIYIYTSLKKKILNRRAFINAVASLVPYIYKQKHLNIFTYVYTNVHTYVGKKQHQHRGPHKCHSLLRTSYIYTHTYICIQTHV